jgi:hypothetical protein
MVTRDPAGLDVLLSPALEVGAIAQRLQSFAGLTVTAGERTARDSRDPLQRLAAEVDGHC